MVLGDYNVAKKERDELHVNICGITVHSSYALPGPKLHDIALLKLCKHVKYTSKIQPISLAAKDFILPKSSSVTVAGWGAVKEAGEKAIFLRKVIVKIIERSACKEAYSRYQVPISNGQICAGNTNMGGKDSCQGDSGGALWYKKNGINVQVGIVSHGIGCARPDGPGVYTSITHYRDWIEEHMNPRLDPSFLAKLPTGLTNKFGELLFAGHVLSPSISFNISTS